MPENTPATAAPTTPAWPLRHPFWAAVGMALVPVVCTAAGFATAQALADDEATTYALAAAGGALSAGIGLLVAARARPGWAGFGLRAPGHAAAVAWFWPLILTPLLVLGASGFQARGALVLPLLALAAAAAINEEVWFRGLVLTALRARGVRFAAVGSAVLFAVLHLANAAGGASAPYAILQVLFAAVFGLVAAEVALITRSLLPGIAWHFAWDAASYLSGDGLDGRALVALGIVVALLAGYAVWLWRRLPAPASAS